MKTLSIQLLACLILVPVWFAHTQWVQTNIKQERIMDIEFVNDLIGFAASGYGPKIYRSSDGGEVWAQYGNNLPQAYAVLSVCQVDETNIVVGTYGGGIYRSTDSGTTWLTASGDDKFTRDIVKAGSVLFAPQGRRSTDNGATWSSLAPALPLGSGNIVENDGDVVYFGGDTTGVYFSTDFGDTWTPVVAGANQPRGATSIHVEGGKIFVGTERNGVYYHDGLSGSWESLAGPDTLIEALVVEDPYVYAGTWGGKVYRYDYRLGTNGWQPVSAGLSPPYMIRSMAKNGTSLFVGSQSAGILKRDLTEVVPQSSVGRAVNGPGTVEFNDLGEATGVTIVFNAVSGSGGVTVMRFGSAPAAPEFTGAAPTYLSSYRWLIEQNGLGAITAEVRFNVAMYLSGIPNPSSVILYVRPSEESGQFAPLTTSYEASMQEFRATVTSFSEFILGSDDNPLTSTAEYAGLPNRTDLYPNWPNPFNSSTGIRYQLSVTSDVRLIVYDVLGREVRVLVDEDKAPGTYEVRFDATGLASGVYLYRLTAGDFVQTRKLLLLK